MIKAITMSFSGTPDRSIADAMSFSGESDEIRFILESFEAAKREAEAKSGKRPGEF